MKTPILFIVFNRPDTTQLVFNAIRIQKPNTLYIAADGPRKGNEGDAKNCIAVKSIFQQIDWACDVKTLFREENLGCRLAVSSAIDWFFNHVEEGIILEDDCLPHPDFFTFSERMLDHYRFNDKVMHITGGNFQFGLKRGEHSYYFSRIPHVWGWATWRRAWKFYDLEMKDFPAFSRSEKLHSFFYNVKSKKYWLFHFARVHKKTTTWDYQWSYTVMKQRGYCIIPNTNLVSNIGFGNQATHAEKTTDPVAYLKTHPIGEITHPQEIKYSEEADLFTIEHSFPRPTLYQMIYNKAKRELRKLISKS